MAPRISVPNTFAPLDQSVDDAWEVLRGDRIADRVFYTASEAANFSVLWHALGIARAIAARDHRIALRTSAALAIESALVNGPIKSIFERDRPDATPEDRPHSLRQPRTSSFPSGHASAAVVASHYIADGASSLWRWPIRALAMIVSTSRIHVRIHHATDVAAGAAAGWVLSRAMKPVLRKIVD